MERIVPMATVVEDLSRRGVGGWETPIRLVFRQARNACPKCGAAWGTSGPA